MTTPIPPLLTPLTNAPTTRAMFRPLAVAASGLTAQRVRMETIASNVANAETTRGPDGAPYRRRVARLEAVPSQDGMAPPTTSRVRIARPGDPLEGVPPLLEMPSQEEPPGNGVAVAGVDEDQTEGPLVYDPGHPDANADGYVRYPNVQVTTEMVDLMEARRIYEANATVFQAAKAMLHRSIDL